MDAVEQSYALQAEGESRMGMPSSYTDPGSIDNWRHTRMHALVQCLVHALPAARWMTVGDGRYGSDAAYLTSIGADVLATSLTDERLKIACERGFIRRYAIENAEHLSCADGAFDFVFCKESYHHFPRPPVALYEMLRASRVGAVLIEPYHNPRVLDAVKRGIKRLLRGDKVFDYEPSGNYLYRINLAELGQLMCAMGNTTLAVKGINDFFHPRLSRERAGGRGLPFLLTRLGVGVQDVLARLGLMGWGLCCVVVFNGTPSAPVREALRGQGFRIIDLPRNPYLGADAA